MLYEPDPSTVKSVTLKVPMCPVHPCNSTYAQSPPTTSHYEEQLLESSNQMLALPGAELALFMMVVESYGYITRIGSSGSNSSSSSSSRYFSCDLWKALLLLCMEIRLFVHSKRSMGCSGHGLFCTGRAQRACSNT
jgi:hypothetical protein